MNNERKELLRKFERYLKKEGMSDNTIFSYTWVVNDYLEQFEVFNLSNLLKYKEKLLQKNSLSTVSQRCIGLNKYLKSINKYSLRLKVPTIGQKQFIENVISHEDYLFFKRKLKKDGYTKYYFIVWFIAATGARVSELVQFKVEHVQRGYMDIYGKGHKHRRIFLPKRLQVEALQWLEKENRHSGYVFLNYLNEQISPKGIGIQLKKYGGNYGIPREVLHPHSFRHLFAKNWIARNKDHTVLADLLGHSSLESLRVYTKLSSFEQYSLVCKTVTW